jgi:hypothetical protein
MSFKIIPNPIEEIYLEVTNAVENNDGYCPCLLERSNDTKCMCKNFREQNHFGECHCGRFVKVEK